MRMLTVCAWPKARNRAQNPYQALLYKAVKRAGGVRVVEFRHHLPWRVARADIFHLHWPDVFLAQGGQFSFWLRLLWLRVLLGLARMCGVKRVWTVHNLYRPDQRHAALLARHFWPWYLSQLNGVVFLGQANANLIGRELNPKTQKAFIPHGHYRPILQQTRVPKHLNSGPPHLVIFGALASYKSVYRVVEATTQLPPGSLRLTIYGKHSRNAPDHRLIAALNALPGSYAPYIHHHDIRLSEPALCNALAKADLAVFPYQQVLNSGAALFALSANCPILASQIPVFEELQADVGDEWVQLTHEPLSGQGLLASAMAGQALHNSGRKPNLSHREWPEIGAKTSVFYRKVCTETAK